MRSERGPHLGEHLADRAVEGEPGRRPVAAAAEPRGHPRHVDRALGPHRRRPPLLTDLLEHERDLGLGRGADGVDDAVDLGGPEAVDVGGGHGRVDEPEPARGVRLQHAAVEGAGQRGEPRERMGVQQLPHQFGGLDARSDELGREAVGGMPGRAEAHGVGDEARVEAARDVDVERHAQSREHAAGDDDRGLRIRVEQLDVAEAGVGHVVVDHDRDAGRVERGGQRAEPGGLSGVARHHDVRRRGHGRRRHHEAEHVEGTQCVGHLVGRREGHPHHRAAPLQGDAECERAAERIGIGLHVRQQRDVGGVGEHIGGGP